MTPTDVHARVAEIAAVRGDSEKCHAMEDRLHQDVLAAIAAGTCTAPATCAGIALETQRLGFDRWCA